MSELIKYYFYYTTAEEQSSYFTGETQFSEAENYSENLELSPGDYRIIDGNLCRIKKGLSKEEVKSILVSRD